MRREMEESVMRKKLECLIFGGKRKEETRKKAKCDARKALKCDTMQVWLKKSDREVNGSPWIKNNISRCCCCCYCFYGLYRQIEIHKSLRSPSRQT